MADDAKPVFHGLFYVDEQENIHVNLANGENPVDIYLRCAALCAASIRYQGYAFRLITNNSALIESRMQALGVPRFEVVQVTFALNVPRGIPFYAAHFKLELYEMFGKGMFGDFAGVIDIDTVMIAPLNFPQLHGDVLLGYDITSQVAAAYGAQRIRADMESVLGGPVAAVRWWGGEFLFGSKESFRKLSTEIQRIWPRYLEKISSLHHVGDEILVSVAAASVADLPLRDAGAESFIVRWWSARTMHRQSSFTTIAHSGILHLPSDKTVLATADAHRFTPASFLAHYKKSVRAGLMLRQVLNPALRLLKRDRKCAAKL